jgi:hypothetical protein
MLYPLSYEGLACTFAQDAGQVSVRWARAGYLRPNGLCRICAACREASFGSPPDTRGRLYGWWCQVKGRRSRNTGVPLLTRCHRL